MSIVDQVKELEERFLSADTKTGMHGVDEPTEEEWAEDQNSEYGEVDTLITILQNSATNAFLSIEQLLKVKHKDKLKETLGDQAEEVLKDARDCLDVLVSVLVGEEIPEEEEDPNSTEESPSEEELDKDQDETK